MKTIEESIATAMDFCQNTAIVPFLPYILQDFWELGTPTEKVIELIQKHYNNFSCLNVLDLGCGKGAVTVKIASTLKCNCYGLDGIPEFIETAKAKACEYGVDSLCSFEVGDVRERVQELDKFDIILLCATGPIYDDYYMALATLSKHLTDNGIVIIDEAYVNDTSTFQHPPYLFRKELIKQFEQAEMELIDENVFKYNEVADKTKEMKNIETRCNELKAKYPEKSSLFENYMQNQNSEYDALENEFGGSVMVLKRVQWNKS